MNDHSPPSSSASDSDAFNTESARLYFGPVKTPERNFVASKKQLHPSATSPFLRRSPRLSTLRVQPPPAVSTTGEEPQETSAQEAEDIDLVARLVNEVEVDDEGESSYDSLFGTPPKGFAELEHDGSSIYICYFFLVFYSLSRTFVSSSRQDFACCW
jgi:hypothetical protein